MRKLALNKETVRVLQDSELGVVAGGTGQNCAQITGDCQIITGGENSCSCVEVVVLPGVAGGVYLAPSPAPKGVLG